jgi:hypothetical protein
MGTDVRVSQNLAIVLSRATHRLYHLESMYKRLFQQIILDRLPDQILRMRSHEPVHEPLGQPGPPVLLQDRIQHTLAVLAATVVATKILLE